MDMSQEVECVERKGDGGISQGISGISPRGRLVNCSVDTGGRGEEGKGKWTRVWVRIPGSGTEVSPSKGSRGKRTSRTGERARRHKSRQSYGLKEAYRSAAAVSVAADAFASEKDYSECNSETKRLGRCIRGYLRLRKIR